MAESSEKDIKNGAACGGGNSGFTPEKVKSPNSDKALNPSASELHRDDAFYGSDDAFCTAAGAMSPRPSARPETGRLRRLFNDCDRA